MSKECSELFDVHEELETFQKNKDTSALLNALETQKTYHGDYALILEKIKVDVSKLGGKEAVKPIVSWILQNRKLSLSSKEIEFCKQFLSS